MLTMIDYGYEYLLALRLWIMSNFIISGIYYLYFKISYSEQDF